VTTELTQCPACWTSPSAYANVKPCELHRFAEKDADPAGVTPHATSDLDDEGPDDSPRVRCIKFPPEVTDGEHWTPVEITDERGLACSLQLWAANAEIGDVLEVEVIEMTKRELEKLPDL